MFNQNIRETQKNKVFQNVVCLKYDMIKWEYGACNNYPGLHKPKLNTNMQIGAFVVIYK